ncbi:hypothetical protein PoB_005690300 [Plakobranchus ocellatus]|uniref:Uncharacterized protein n=1 Tax=Plakobranchus ocellatus TaxID=259542 RepID=A0AAV4CEP0_9GAST|nr:hypothetical protein PoB_005690300 [Plakobranchus ocellatus]
MAEVNMLSYSLDMSKKANEEQKQELGDVRRRLSQLRRAKSAKDFMVPNLSESQQSHEATLSQMSGSDTSNLKYLSGSDTSNLKYLPRSDISNQRQDSDAFNLKNTSELDSSDLRHVSGFDTTLSIMTSTNTGSDTVGKTAGPNRR